MIVKKQFVLPVLLITAFFGTGASTAGANSEFLIAMDENGFSPDFLDIKQGETVVFENTGDEPRWPASNIHPTHRMYPESGIEFCGTKNATKAFDACRPLLPGESYSFTFDYPGNWRFHDHIRPEFSGKIRVEAKDGLEPVTETTPTATETYRVYDDTQPEDSPGIFDDAISLYSYVRKFGPAKTIRYLHELQAEYGDCHQRAHHAGRYAYEIFGSDSFKTCSAECHSGCYHGATEAYFRDHGTSNLAHDLAIICSAELNSFYTHQCYHGVGHGLMAYANYDLFEALENCDLLPEGRQSCYSGVYMENVVGGLAPTIGHFTKYLSDDPHFPCNIVPAKYTNACYHYQTSRMLQLFPGDFASVADACNEAESTYQQSCFLSMGRDVAGSNHNGIVPSIRDCRKASEGQQRIWCLQGAVQNTFWDAEGQGVALEFCTALLDEAETFACYETIFKRAPQILQTDSDIDRFCSRVERAYVERCLKVTRGG